MVSDGVTSNPIGEHSVENGFRQIPIRSANSSFPVRLRDYLKTVFVVLLTSHASRVLRYARGESWTRCVSDWESRFIGAWFSDLGEEARRPPHGIGAPRERRRGHFLRCLVARECACARRLHDRLCDTRKRCIGAQLDVGTRRARPWDVAANGRGWDDTQRTSSRCVGRTAFRDCQARGRYRATR